MSLTLTKPFAVIRYQKAEMEDYNPQIVEEADTESEAQSIFDMYADADDSYVEGYEIVYRDGTGGTCHYDGEPLRMPTYK